MLLHQQGVNSLPQIEHRLSLTVFNTHRESFTAQAQQEILISRCDVFIEVARIAFGSLKH